MEDRRGGRLTGEAVELAAGEARAFIAREGAEAFAWRVAGRDLLWRRDTDHWDRVAPILFPCVGWSRDGVVRVDGRSYPMPVHGFAAAARFSLIERACDSALFELASNRDTLAIYPFQFRLRAGYRLAPRALHITLDICNEGDAPMPYACGLHPGFAWPFAGGVQDDHRIVFEAEERAEVPVIAPGGLFARETRAVPLEGRVLRLGASTFEREALCFLNARSRRVTFAGPRGAIECEAQGFRHWAVWSRPGAPFVCVEAWTGHGDPVGFTGDFHEKPSIDVLAPGARRVHALTLRYVD